MKRGTSSRSEREKQHTKEGIRQRYRLDTPHVQVGQKVWVQVEEDRHVHRLPGAQSLLFKAKTLDLAEIGSYLAGCYAVCSDPNDVGIAQVGGCVESKRSFAG